MGQEDRQVFVGRVGEFAALGTMLAAMRSGGTRTVLIEGYAGIGKTSLVEQFLAEVEDEVRVLRASGEQWEAMVSYGVIDQLLRNARVRGTRQLASRERSLPLEEPVSVGAYLLDFLSDLEQKSPLIVAIEDVHWTDKDSLRALLFVLRRLVSERVLTLLTVRSEETERLPEGLQHLAREPTGLTVRLDALAAAEVQRLGTELGVPDFSALAARRLQEHTRGNPLFVRALLTELPVDRWRTWEPVLPAPRAFAVQVERRLEACAVRTRRLVEAVSTLGATAPLSAAAALAGVEDPLSALDEAKINGLLQVRDEPGIRDVVFPHPLVQAAVYGQLGPARRVRLHLAAAELVQEDGARLRHRVAAAEPPDEGLAGELLEFAQRQAAVGAWGPAVSALVDAARITGLKSVRDENWLHAVDLLAATGALVDADVVLLDGAFAAPGALRDAVLGHRAVIDGRRDEAEALLDRAWEWCDFAGDAATASLVAERHALHNLGRLRPQAVIDWARRAMALAPAGNGLAGLTAEALLHTGPVWTGRLPGGTTAAAPDRAEATGSVTGHPSTADDLVVAGGAGLSNARDGHRGGWVAHRALAHAWSARAEFVAGSWDEAVAAASRAVALLEETGHEWLRPLARWAAVGVPAARGEWGVAEEHARLAVASGGDYELMVVAGGLAGAQVAAARGDHQGVLAALGPVVGLASREGVDEPGFWPWPGLYGDALVSAGRLGEAEEFLGPHEELAAVRGRRLGVAALARVRGRLESAAGRGGAAEEAFERGFAALEGFSVPFERALVEWGFGQVLRRHGHRRAGVERLEAARAGFVGLGAVPYVERCERELGASGLAPAKRHDFDPSRLTAQESAVARLVARGLSNREVASELFVSVKTVQFHLTRVYSKLRIRSRTELAAIHTGVPQLQAADGRAGARPQAAT